MGKNKINLTENRELIKADLETVEILNDFFFQTECKILTLQDIQVTKLF